MTAAAQLQGARLTTGRRRRSDCLTTFETLTMNKKHIRCSLKIAFDIYIFKSACF
jgi:hypothetical protein